MTVGHGSIVTSISELMHKDMRDYLISFGRTTQSVKRIGFNFKSGTFHVYHRNFQQWETMSERRLGRSNIGEAIKAGKLYRKKHRR